MASISHPNNPSLANLDSPGTVPGTTPSFMPGGHHGHHGAALHHHAPPPFWGGEGPAKHGRHGHRGGRGRGRGRHHHPDEGSDTQQNEEAEHFHTAEQHAEPTPSTVTMIPGTRETNSETLCGLDPEIELGHGRKDKHTDFHNAGKGGRGGKGCRGRHGHGRGHRGGYGKFGGRGHGGSHSFGHPHPHPHAHPYHSFGHGGPFHRKGHHRGGLHGRGRWPGDALGPNFYEPFEPHPHGPKQMYRQLIRNHHHALQAQAHSMRYAAELMRFQLETMCVGPATYIHGEANFEPCVDVFDASTKYVIHASLAGAKKSDINLEYDYEESKLHLSGIVHRPGMDEELQQTLAIEERYHEIGTFEKTVQLGLRSCPASVLVEGITAKLEEGVLVITIPKTEEPGTSKKIPVECECCYEEDLNDASKEIANMVLDENSRENVATPDSEEVDWEEEDDEGMGYVKIAVQ